MIHVCACVCSARESVKPNETSTSFGIVKWHAPPFFSLKSLAYIGSLPPSVPFETNWIAICTRIVWLLSLGQVILILVESKCCNQSCNDQPLVFNPTGDILLVYTIYTYNMHTLPNVVPRSQIYN